MRTALSREAKVNVSYCDHEARYLTIPCLGRLLQDHHMLLSEQFLMYSHRQAPRSICSHLECLWTRSAGEAPAHLLPWLSRSFQLIKSFPCSSETPRGPAAASG